MLVFTGPNVPPATLGFKKGVNLVWGASNTGKSFTLKSIDFMLGGSKSLPDIEERNGYEKIWMGISLDGVGDFTLRRSASGGNYELYTGLVSAAPNGVPGQKLRAKHDAKSRENLSVFLLDHLGFIDKLVAEDTYGHKRNLRFRDLARFVLVDETSIQSERSPVESGQHSDSFVERSVFRLLLSGSDDSSLVEFVDGKTFDASRTARLAMTDELIAEVDAELAKNYPDANDLERKSDALVAALDVIQGDFERARQSVESLIKEKQRLSGTLPAVGARLDEIEAHLVRFQQLDRVYASDVDRLESLEETGFLFALRGGRDCPVCGAPPEAHRVPHGNDDIESVRNASIAEINKIVQQRADLTEAVNDLGVERSRLTLLRRSFPVRMCVSFEGTATVMSSVTEGTAR